MELRPYQEEAVRAVEREWASGHRRTLLALPTGTGKTIVFAKIVERVADGGGRSLVLAHRGELLDQAAEKIAAVTGLPCAVEKAELTSLGGFEAVTVGSVQTLMREGRLSRFSPSRYDCIVVDEAHHALADSYRRILDHFGGADVLGVTATPDRADRRQLGEVFDSLAYEYSLPKAIRDGYLCPIEAQTIPLDIDIRHVAVQHGDWSASQLGNALDPYLDAIADAMADAGCRGRRTVVFLPLVRTAEAFRDRLAERGFRAAEVDGLSGDRAEVLDAFQRGEYDVLCNSMLLTEGWDCPSVDCIVVLRPTKSRPLYCLDEETEVLTHDGWRKDVEVGEDVLAFDRDTGETRFVAAVAKVRRKLGPDECFCSIKGQSADIRVTDRHRMLYDDKRHRGWKIKEARELAEMRDGAYIPVCGHGRFPGVPLADAELTFIGWVMTDGSINPTNGQITITQGEQQADHCDEIERCITECGFKFGKSIFKRKDIHWNAHGDCVRWTVSKGKPRGRDKDRTGWGRLEPWLSKDMSPALFDMTERQFAVMLDAIFHGDGNKSNTLTYDIGKGNRIFIERLQAMAIQRGYRANVSVEKANKVRKCDLWHAHIKKRGFVKVGAASGRHARWIMEPRTDETCWCVQNELGTLVTRRNGKVAIVGNCQMVGRGTRLSPGTGKGKLLLLDFLWMTGRHELCRPASLVAKSAEVARRMAEISEEAGGPCDLMEAEERAESDVQRAREEAVAEELKRLRHRKARLVDPLQFEMSICDADLSSYVPEFAWQMAPVTEAQAEALERAGIDPGGVGDCGKASMILDRLSRRREAGLATPRQIRQLEQRGFLHAGTWGFEEASRMMTRLARNGWRTPRDIDPAAYVPEMTA